MNDRRKQSGRRGMEEEAERLKQRESMVCSVEKHRDEMVLAELASGGYGLGD